ncbi:uncharacterized protein LOC110027136 isoform X2 [Phalaenopsis equestris]|uniref:uncharacterized protein LOC110027136 isoform X2 n=1 Tax=Phalaenopsis equestris TaxID=78828 RepID=UPI0009E5C5A5|nr:uncharacterized protein LOC110027136 isoform X2 [Phalaenopsis equestris]
MVMAMAIATATSALSRRYSGLAPHVFSTISPTPYGFFFSTSTLNESFSIRSHALRPLTPPSDGSDIGDDDTGLKNSRDSFKKSRNELKREARRAVRWGMDLSTFSLPQIKSILRAASLEREVLDAILLRLGPDVREGRRRQFNFIGRLLRKAQPELMDALIQASRDGDKSKLQDRTGQGTSSIFGNDDDEEDIESELEEGENYMKLADKWLDGLIRKDPTVTNEVYSIHSVDFDRQELRRLVRNVQSILEPSQTDQIELEGDDKLNEAKKSLLRFLRLLAKKLSAELQVGYNGYNADITLRYPLNNLPDVRSALLTQIFLHISSLVWTR